MIQGVIGIAAGPIIHYVLATRPGPPGYAILHLIAFGFVMASLAVIAPMRETDFPDPRAHAGRSYLEQLLQIPRRALQVPEFLRYLGVRFTSVGYMLLSPYMAIHALAVTGRTEEDVGFFVTAQMVGWIFGNFLAARVGDRSGGKAVMLAARLVLVAVAIFVAVNASFAGFVAGFFFFGFAFAMERVGDLTLGVELCPREDRQGFLALLTFVLMPATILAATTAAIIQKTSGAFPDACIAAVLLTLVSLALLLRVREPRRGLAEESIALDHNP
jgi:predicted MFS family arabinose efflux permease